MFKLVVLFALLAFASASYIHAPTTYAAAAVGIPSAVSYQARTDVVNKPILSTSTYAAAPVVAAYAAPVVKTVAPAIAVPSAVSYQSRTDVINKPVVSTTTYIGAAAPIIETPIVKPVAPVVKTVAPAIAVPSAVSYQSRTDVVNKPIISTTTYAAAPVISAAPIVKTESPVVEAVVPAVAAPSAVSYQARTDIVNKPVVTTTTYAAAAPVIKTTYPIASSYAAPAIISSYAAPAKVVTGYPAFNYVAERVW